MQTGKSLGNKEKKMGIVKKIYILHGWTYSTEGWKKIDSFLRGKGLKTVILKIPGLTEKIEKPWAISDYLAWLKKIVEKEKGEVILLGHSNGGRIAANFAVRYPQLVKKLILIDSAGIYHNELPIKIKRFLFGTAAKFGKKLTSSKILKNLLYKMARTSDYKNASFFSRKTMLNLLKSDANFDFSKIKTQTLIIWGKLDTTTPFKDGESINRAIENSELFVVTNAKHSPQFTNPEIVCDKIAKFIHDL